MPGPLQRLRSLLLELRRRKVVRAVLAYSAPAAGLIAFASDVENALGLPDPTDTVIVVAALLGFPIVVVASWLFELTPDAGPVEDVAVAIPANAAPAEPTGDAIPTPGTAFIGRRRELTELIDLLQEAQTRLVTVIGPGGTGKTRLALSAAESLAPRFAQGARYVALSALPSHELLAPAIAESLGLVLSRRDDVAAELLDYLREKELLLVLDNFDDLVAAAPLVGSIIEHAPHVRVLVTTRERLNLIPEILLPLDGLRTEPDAVGQSDAVDLFVAAARRQDRSFQLDATNREHVQRICELVGGLPLAIELAAAWVRVMSTEEILQHLAHSYDILSSTSPGLPERHRSMRATFESSWRLLSEEEQHAVAQLSVIRSDFDRDTAVAVAGADVPLLRSLLDKSFLARSGGQFLMLDVVRQYAQERLERNPDEERRARQGHLQYFADLLESLEHDAQRWDPKAFARIVEDMDDVRAAWSYAVETVAADVFVRTANTLYHLYDARGWAREGAQAFRNALDALEKPGSPAVQPTRGILYVRGGALNDRLGAAAEAETMLREGLRLARHIRAPGEVIFALQKLTTNRVAVGEYVEAESLAREAVELSRQSSNAHHLAWSWTHLGNVVWAIGNYDEGERLYSEALHLMRQEKDRFGIWVTLNNLGVIAGARQKHHQARNWFLEALEVQKELGNQRSLAMLLHNLGSAAHEMGDYEQAKKYLQDGLAISDSIGYRNMQAQSSTVLAEAFLRTGDVQRARGAMRRGLQSATAAHNYPAVLAALVMYAQIRMQEGYREEAVALAHAITAHPAAHQDTRDEISRLIQKLDVPTSDAISSIDLQALIADILHESVSIAV